MCKVINDRLAAHPVDATLQLIGMGLAAVALVAVLMPITIMSIDLWLASIRLYPNVNLVTALLISSAIYVVVKAHKLLRN